MRSHSEMRVLRVLLVVLAAIMPATVFGQEGVAPAESQRPGPEDISRALEQVKADPNLATDKTIKTLRWKDSKTPKRSSTPAWLAWIGGMFGWLGESARLLVWLGAAALAGLLVVFLIRLVRTVRLPDRELRFVAPTHVGDLDIRPETLPHDIGAAARALWDRGEHRAALALLYRGLLSRLAHVHEVPIRDSSTEGDCLALTARSQLSPPRREYASRLVRVWQRAVYGREEVEATTVYVLCDGFASALNPVTPLNPSSPGDAA